MEKKSFFIFIWVNRKIAPLKWFPTCQTKQFPFVNRVPYTRGLEAQHCTKRMVMDSASVATAPVHRGSPGSIISHLSQKAVILHALDWGLCSFAKDVSSFLKCLCFPWELICGDSCLLIRKRQPTPVLLPVKFHGWRNLVGYSPWSCKELDTTERLHFPCALCLLDWA